MQFGSMLSADVKTSLLRVAAFLNGAKDPWWILGSAAVAVKGYDAGEIADIDVLVSAADAERLMSANGLPNAADGGTDRYRSRFFLLPALGSMRVEIMAGYEIRSDAGWLSVWPTSRERVAFGSHDLYVPSDRDLIDIFNRLGRPKDILRRKALQAG